ncbi:hypothetical protein RHRU231_230014 [Rhodococcus ruber]|uniref:Uncharacterized protein n=1 Tax=Rhodococcus ruber TaxID=1830 RepID=A0A098BHJ0_9NOCA|nr:hypothetical protein RHRU231_230014 [Rhodococcus ruber]
MVPPQLDITLLPDNIFRCRVRRGPIVPHQVLYSVTGTNGVSLDFPLYAINRSDAWLVHRNPPC